MESKNGNSGKKILAFFALAALMAASTLAWARPYRNRVHDSKVNTPIERSYDRNHDGWIGPRERVTMAHNRVNRPVEYRCDINRNGWIDTPRERICQR